VPNHFASSELRRDATRRRARLLLNQASVAVLLAGIAWGGYVIWQVLQSDQLDQRTSQQLQALNREYDEIVRSLPSRGVGGAAMRDSVAFYNGTIRTFPTLTDFLIPVSQVLETHPRVRLLQLAWQAASEPTVTPVLPATPMSAQPPVRSSKGLEAAPPSAPGTLDAPFTNGRFQVALIEGSVRVDGVDFRSALGELDQLAADLSRVPGYKAEIVESPLDMRPGLSVQGRLGEDTAPSDARFTMRVVRERAAP
jgi:hypothetical protein